MAYGINFTVCFVIPLVAGGVTQIDINRKPANLSEAGEIICALKDKLSTCEQLLRENRWPLLVRGEIDRLADRYAAGVILTDAEMKEVTSTAEDSKKRKLMRTMVCEHMMNLTNYVEIAGLKARIDEARQKDDQITVKSFCEVLSDTYECISENGAPYLRLQPGERRPKIVNMLTADNVNKYLNILMKNVNEQPIKEDAPTENKGSNSSTTAAGIGPSKATTVTVGGGSANTTASTGKESAGTTASVGGKKSASTTASGGEESVATTASVGKQSASTKAAGGKESLKTTANSGTTVAGSAKKNGTKT